MKKLVLCLCAGFAILTPFAQQKKPNPKDIKISVKQVKSATLPAPIKTLVDSFSYQAGYNVGSNMLQQGITEVNAELIKRGIEDYFAKRAPMLDSKVGNAALNRQLEVFQRNKQADEKSKADQMRAAGAAFLEKNKTNQGVITLPDGLQYEVLQQGDSMAHRPAAKDTVIVNYVGTTLGGYEFDNSYKRGQPAVFPLERVIPGWIEVLQLMRVGAKFKAYIPNLLAYGDNPPPGSGINPGEMLIFELSLEGIKPQTVQ